MAATINAAFTMHSGNNKSLDFTVLDTAGAPIDITGATFTFKLTPLNTSDPANPAPKGDTLLTLTLGAQLVITDAPAGEVSVLLIPVDTTALGSKGFYYELTMLLAGLTFTVAIGSINILKDAS